MSKLRSLGFTRGIRSTTLSFWPTLSINGSILPAWYLLFQPQFADLKLVWLSGQMAGSDSILGLNFLVDPKLHDLIGYFPQGVVIITTRVF